MLGLDNRITETYPTMKKSGPDESALDEKAIEGNALAAKVKTSLGLTYAAMAAYAIVISLSRKSSS